MTTTTITCEQLTINTRNNRNIYTKISDVFTTTVTFFELVALRQESLQLQPRRVVERKAQDVMNRDEGVFLLSHLYDDQYAAVLPG